jgi:CRP-like cAMP-binding protein
LTSEEIQALLADNSDLVPGLFQMLFRDSHAGRAVVRGHYSPRAALPANGNFNAIEKGLVLKTIPVFSQVSPDEIIALASIATEMHLTSNTDLFTETSRPAIYALISGEVSLEKDSESPVIAGPFDVIGIYETLAGMDFKFHARIRQDGIALRIEHEDLFDLLAQRSALLRQVLGALFRSQPTGHLY